MIWNVRYMIEPIMTLNMAVMICQIVFEMQLMQADFWYRHTHDEDLVRYCLKHKSNETCATLSNDTSDDVSRFRSYLSIEMGLIGIFVNLFVGYLSDVLSRTIVMKVSCVASLFLMGLHLYNSLVMSMPIYWFFVGYLIAHCGSAWGAIIATSFAYISDVSDKETRTTRIAIADSMLQLGSVIASYLSGWMVANSRWWSVPAMCCSLTVLMLLYITIVIRNPPRTKRNYEGSVKQMLKSMVDIYTTKSKQRARIYILSVAYLLHLTAFITCAGFLFNYLLMPPFNWKADKCGLVSSISGLGNFVLVLAVPLLKKCRINETAIAVISCALCAAGFGVMIVADSFAWVIIAMLLKAGSGMAIAIYRSRLSKLVKPTQFGQLFSLLSSCESFAGIISSVALYQIYIVTREWFNGFNFIILVALEIVALLLTLLDGMWEARLARQAEQETEVDEDEEILPLPASDSDKQILVN